MARSRAALVLVLLTLASCNLWPGELGGVTLPYTQDEARRIATRPVAKPAATVEEGLEAIRERRPVDEDVDPAVVQEAADRLEPMSVAEMRLEVLRNNLNLQVAVLQPELARAQVSAEEGRFDALIGSRFRIGRSDTPALDGPIVEFTSADPALDGRVAKLTEVEQVRERLGFGVGLTVPLPSGGKIELETLLDRKDTTDPQRFEQDLAATRFSISQPLLRGAGPASALAPLRIARVDERAAEVRTKLAAMRVLADAEKAYWRLYASRQVLDVRAEQFRLASENLEVVRRRVEEGLTPRVEIVRAEVGVYERVEALILAETDWRLRQRDLEVRLAGGDDMLRGDRLVDVTTDPLLAGLELDAGELVRGALDQRLELIEIELALVRDGLAVDFRRNQALPIANLDFGYGVLGRDDGLGRAADSQWDFDNGNLWAGISFELPLTNQRGRAQLRAAILAKAQRLASRRARSLMVREEVLDAVDVIRRDWQRIVAARQNVIVAGVNYDAERRQFEQGMRTMREVFEALSDVGDAQVREIRAIVDYQVAQIDLAFATGNLLGYARVDLGELRVPVVSEAP